MLTHQNMHAKSLTRTEATGYAIKTKVTAITKSKKLLYTRNNMTIFEFNEQLCEIIAGEDGYYNYDKQEILDLAKQMKTSAEEYQNMLDCKDAAEVHELMNPAVCDV